MKGVNKTASRQKSFSFKWWLCAVAIAYGWLQTVKKIFNLSKNYRVEEKVHRGFCLHHSILSPQLGHNNIKPFHWAGTLLIYFSIRQCAYVLEKQSWCWWNSYFICFMISILIDIKLSMYRGSLEDYQWKVGFLELMKMLTNSSHQPCCLLLML